MALTAGENVKSSRNVIAVSSRALFDERRVALDPGGDVCGGIFHHRRQPAAVEGQSIEGHIENPRQPGQDRQIFDIAVVQIELRLYGGQVIANETGLASPGDYVSKNLMQRDV